MEYFLGLIVWFVIGYQGFVWWWTKDYDLRVKDRRFAFAISFLGPINWLIGWNFHSEFWKQSLFDDPNRIIKEQRK